MRLKFAAAVITSVLSFAAAAEAAEKPDLVATFRDWHVYSTGGGANRSCYLLSVPTAMTPKTMKRGNVSFLISTWPAQKVKHEPSVAPGYRYKEMGAASVQVGETKFALTTQNQRGAGGAWLAMPEDEPKLVDAMKRGSELTVIGVDSKGVLTRDNYSLAGFSAALDKLDSVCK